MSTLSAIILAALRAWPKARVIAIDQPIRPCALCGASGDGVYVDGGDGALSCSSCDLGLPKRLQPAPTPTQGRLL
jgi:hypothetical protein